MNEQKPKQNMKAVSQNPNRAPEPGVANDSNADLNESAGAQNDGDDENGDMQDLFGREAEDDEGDQNMGPGVK